ncbi:unnamed protein product [Phaedon cochleariae]|uniref:Cuticle protein n=1 Tax=Phaedon cochleariae TaxID=80249 RepID=A0A9P0DM43_PHACE|nr:unnamed protein product [Phaedon cochleariae]
MAFKFVAIFALVTVAQAGLIGQESRPAYSDSTAVSYSSISSPINPHDAAASPLAARAPSYAAPTVTSPSFFHSSAPSAPIREAAPEYRLAAPSSYAAPSHARQEEYAPAHYSFGYEVNDPHTGDVHGQQETREGDVVKGSYSLVEADGSRRLVEYTVDAHSGFNAVVHREAAAGHVKNAAPSAVVRPVAYAAPQAVYAAPRAAHAYSSPAVARLGAPAVAKSAYSSAPAAFYSSVSAPVVRHAAAPSYYH